MLIKQRPVGTPGRLGGCMILPVASAAIELLYSNTEEATTYNDHSINKKLSLIGPEEDDVAERFEDWEGFEDDDVEVLQTAAVGPPKPAPTMMNLVSAFGFVSALGAFHGTLWGTGKDNETVSTTHRTTGSTSLWPLSVCQNACPFI